MRIEKNSPSFFPSTEIKLQERGKYTEITSSLCSSVSPTRAFSRIKALLLAPYRWCKIYFFPKTSSLYYPQLKKTGEISSHAKKIHTDLSASYGPEQFAFSRDEQVRIVDQFDLLLEYTTEFKRNNFGKIDGTLRFDTGTTYIYQIGSKEKMAKARAQFIEDLKKLRHADFQLVLTLSYDYQSPFGTRAEKITHPIVVKTKGGLKFT